MVMDGDRLVLGRQREVGGFGTDFVARASRTHWWMNWGEGGQ